MSFECEMRNDKRFMALIFALVLSMAGCAGFGKRLNPPGVHLSNIELQGIQGLESVMRIDLRVFNDNDVPIVVKGIDCELGISGKHLASGLSSSEVSIPAYETAVVPVTVYSSILDVFRGILELRNLERLKYHVQGRIRLEAGLFAPSSVPFKAEGELSFDAVLKQLRPT
jgi:LEA14-like dessication related protein